MKTPQAAISAQEFSNQVATLFGLTQATEAARFLGRLGGKAGKGKSKARDSKAMKDAGRKGSTVRWCPAREHHNDMRHDGFSKCPTCGKDL